MISTRTPNDVTMIGNLTKDLELKQNNGGNDYVIASVAVNNWRSDLNESQTLYINCSLWKGLAVNAAKELKKGDSVVISGKLQFDETTGGNPIREVEDKTYSSFSMMGNFAAKVIKDYLPKGSESKKEDSFDDDDFNS